MGSASALLTLLLTVNPYLEEGRRLYEGLHYQDAEPRLELAAKSPLSTPEERLEIYDLLARCRIAQGKLEAAEHAYAGLLQEQPNAHTPINASPRVRAAFDRAKKALYAPDFVALTQLPAPA